MTMFTWIFIAIVLFVIFLIWDAPIIVETVNEEIERNEDKNKFQQPKRTPDWTGYGRFAFVLPDGKKVLTYKNTVSKTLVFVGDDTSEWQFHKFGYEGPIQETKVTQEHNRVLMDYTGKINGWYVMLQKPNTNKTLFLDVYSEADGTLHQNMVER